MFIPNVAGYWTGEIVGTNRAGLVLDIQQSEERITGSAKMQEPSLGQYEYRVDGFVKEGMSFKLTPVRQSGGLNLGNGHALCQLLSDGTLSGRWKTDIGTEGAFTAKRFENSPKAPLMPQSNFVFLVHGHDDGAKHAVARFLEQLGVSPVILQEQINSGMTVIEKLETFAAKAGYAIVLMTPDDEGFRAGCDKDKKPRPRQNVVLELGYFAALLGRKKTMVLTKGDLELPSDVMGLIYQKMDNGQGWKMSLAQELKAAGFTVDLNRAI